MTEQPKKKPARKALEDHASWKPAKWELADASAIQALARGDASKDQQQRVLQWVIERAAGTYDMSYRPQSSRDTDFAEGRRWVGLQIVTLLKADLSKLRREENG